MIKRITTPYELEQEFNSYDRNYFSLDAYDFMLDCFEEDEELDVIGICCDFTEYGEHGASCDFGDFVNDYGYVYPFSDFCADNDYSESDSDFCSVYEEYINELADELDEIGNACTYHMPNGNVLVIA